MLPCFNGTPQIPDQREDLINQTITCWDEAIAAPDQPANVDVRPKISLSLGTLYILLTSTTNDRDLYWQEGERALSMVIQAYEQGDDAFQQRFRRYAGYAYGRRALLTVYYPDFLAPAEKDLDDYRQARDDYQLAVNLLQTTEPCRADVSKCLKDDQPAIQQFLVELCHLQQRLGEGTANPKSCSGEKP